MRPISRILGGLILALVLLLCLVDAGSAGPFRRGCPSCSGGSCSGGGCTGRQCPGPSEFTAQFVSAIPPACPGGNCSGGACSLPLPTAGGCTGGNCVATSGRPGLIGAVFDGIQTRHERRVERRHHRRGG